MLVQMIVGIVIDKALKEGAKAFREKGGSKALRKAVARGALKAVELVETVRELLPNEESHGKRKSNGGEHERSL